MFQVCPQPIGLVLIQPTPFCNIDCRYCYLPERARRNVLEERTLAKIYERLFASAHLGKTTRLVWHCGEPLTVPVRFYEKAFELLQRFNVKGVGVKLAFQTNATLLNQEWCDLIKAQQIGVGVSIDGPQRFHDANRVTRSGKGTFERAMRGVALLRQNDIPFFNIAVLTSAALDYPDELWEFFVSHGFTRLCFNVEESTAANAPSSVQHPGNRVRYRSFFRRLLELQKSSSLKVEVRELDDMETRIARVLGLSEPPDEAEPRGVVTRPLATLSFDWQGNYSTFSPELLTDQRPGPRAFHFGNVHESGIDDILESERLREVNDSIQRGIARCRSGCAYFLVCGGGDPADKLAENGTFDSTETMRCRLNPQALADAVLEGSGRGLATLVKGGLTQMIEYKLAQAAETAAGTSYWQWLAQVTEQELARAASPVVAGPGNPAPTAKAVRVSPLKDPERERALLAELPLEEELAGRIQEFARRLAGGKGAGPGTERGNGTLPAQPGAALAAAGKVEAPPCEGGRDPWSWRPAVKYWCERLAAAAQQWRPAPELGLQGEPLIERLREAARQNASWLFHPCLNPVLNDPPARRLEGDLQLALWLEAQGAPTAGHVHVPREVEVWTPDGGNRVPAGRYALSALARPLRRPWPWPIALDIWCRLLPSRSRPVLGEDSWPTASPLTAEGDAELERDVRLFLRALTSGQRTLGPMLEWVTTVTKVVVPLRRREGVSRSSCAQELPGLIFLDLPHGLQILESLVHESAHQYLFRAEAAGPLVEPGHTGLYRSPLRADPRPLRGVLLAYHALAYIGAFYADAVANGLAVSRAGEQLPTLRQQLQAAEQTLMDNRRFLTTSGNLFLEQTREVGSYSEN
jgi:uncharacterized protein